MIFHANKHFLIASYIVLYSFRQLQKDVEGVHYNNTTLMCEH